MLFPDLPDAARLWTYTAARPLDADAQARLLERLRPFLAGWASHGRPIAGDATVLHDRFLVIAAFLPGDVSGCGIDTMTRAVAEAGEAAGVAWLDALHVAFRRPDGSVEVVPRPTFRAAVRAGEVTPATPVFVTTLESLADLRAEGFERPAGASWHAAAFRIPAPA